MPIATFAAASLKLFLHRVKAAKSSRCLYQGENSTRRSCALNFNRLKCLAESSELCGPRQLNFRGHVRAAASGMDWRPLTMIVKAALLPAFTY